MKNSTTLVIGIALGVAGWAYYSHEKARSSALAEEIAAQDAYAQQYLEVGDLAVTRIADGSVSEGAPYAFSARLTNKGPTRLATVDVEFQGPNGWMFTGPEDDDERQDSLRSRVLLLGTMDVTPNGEIDYIEPGETVLLGENYRVSAPDPLEIRTESAAIRADQMRLIEVGCSFVPKDK